MEHQTFSFKPETAKRISSEIQKDIDNGIYKNFPIVEVILVDIIQDLQVLNKPLEYIQKIELRAQGYLKGYVPCWYYPKCTNNWKIVRD